MLSPAHWFHLGEGWNGPWRDAYLGTATALAIGGLPMLAETARIGPLRYRRLRSRTNIHTAQFDSPEGGAIPADLPQRMLDEGRADLAVIDYVPEDGRLLSAAREWSDRYQVAIDPLARVPVTDTSGDFDRWLGARSKRDRARWPKLERRLAGETALRFEMLDGSDGLDPLLHALFALEAAGWKGSAGTAMRDDGADLLFYTELARSAADARALRIAVLREGERIAAFEYAILSGNRLFVLKAAYDEAHAGLSIGHVLAMQHIRHCCGDPAIAAYDVLGNGLTPSAHKLRFCDRVETLYRIRIHGRGPRAEALRLAVAARRRVKRLRDRWRARA